MADLYDPDLDGPFPPPPPRAQAPSEPAEDLDQRADLSKLGRLVVPLLIMAGTLLRADHRPAPAPPPARAPMQALRIPAATARTFGASSGWSVRNDAPLLLLAAPPGEATGNPGGQFMGSVTTLTAGTSVAIVEWQGTSALVRIESGPYRDRIGWVSRDLLSAPALDPGLPEEAGRDAANPLLGPERTLLRR